MSLSCIANWLSGNLQSQYCSWDEELWQASEQGVTTCDARSRKSYSTDILDSQWVILGPLLLEFEERVRPGPKREVNLREVVNTLRYINRTGCQWGLIPHDLLPKSTVYDYFAKWRDHGIWAKVNEVSVVSGDPES